MPNWCTTNYRFYPVNRKKEARKALVNFKSLLQTVVDIEEKEIQEKGRIRPWLGRLLQSCNIDTTFNCRGYLFAGNDTKIDGELALEVSTDTAWGPMPEVFTSVIEKCFSDENGEPLLDMVYVADEPGMGLYITNDVEKKVWGERINIDLNVFGREMEVMCEDEYSAMEEFSDFFEEDIEEIFPEKWKLAYEREITLLDEFRKREKKLFKGGRKNYDEWLRRYEKAAENLENIENYEKIYEDFVKGKTPDSYKSWFNFFKTLVETDEDGWFAINEYEEENTPWGIETKSFVKEGETVIYKFFENENILIGKVDKIAEDGTVTLTCGGYIKEEYEVHPGNDGIVLHSFKIEKEKAAEEAA